jgi:hypothetical protein
MKTQKTFNEKCDLVLTYLKNRPSRFVESTTIQKFTEETGISIHDNAVIHLQIDKNYIEYDKSDINITSLGASFIENNSFHKMQQDTELSSSLLWYNADDAKQRFEDYPKVKKQRNIAFIFSGLTLLIAAIAVYLQWRNHQ